MENLLQHLLQVSSVKAELYMQINGCMELARRAGLNSPDQAKDRPCYLMVISQQV